MTKACKPKKKRGHKRALSRVKLINLNVKRKQWPRKRPATTNRLGRTVLLNKVAADVKEAHVVTALRRFGPIVRVRLFKRRQGTQEGAAKLATVQFKTQTGADNAVKTGRAVSICGVEVIPKIYERQTETRDPRLSHDLCVKRSVRKGEFWRVELLNYFAARALVYGPEGFADRKQVLHTIGGQSKSTLMTFLPDSHSHELEKYYNPTYRFSHLDPAIRNRLVSSYMQLYWNVLVKQWIKIVRLREGKGAARTLQRLLDSADTPAKRCVVLELCTSVLTVLNYVRTTKKDATGLGAHRDQPKYGEVISAITLSGACKLTFFYTDPVTRQQVEYDIRQLPGRGYCFAGGWRHIAHHAVSNLDADGRVVVLWRFWLPGRVGLVPMFKEKVFMGYRRLNKGDKIEDRSDFSYHKDLKVELEDAIDYSELQAAIQAASE